MMTHVEMAILDAWNVGRQFNLDDCLYGIPHWLGEPPDRPVSYYFFLAGIASSQRCRRALEIGTHMGGSVSSIRKGMGEALETLVTIDPTDLSDPILARYPEITKIQGLSSDPAIISRVLAAFGWKPIDLLYIDADHSYESTIQQPPYPVRAGRAPLI